MKMNEKGIMTYDFIIAIFLFLTAYVVTMQVITYPMTRQDIEIDQKKPTNTLMANTLTQNPGEPCNWNEIGEVNSLGLSLCEKGNNPNILDIQKLKELNNTYCSELEDKIPLKTPINIEVKIIDENKTYKCQRDGYIPERKIETWPYVWNGEEYKIAKTTIQTW